MANKQIKLNHGLEAFDILFEDCGETVTIYFNPTDAELPKRMFKAKQMIEEKSKNIKEFGIDESGAPKLDEYVEMFDEMSKAVYDTVDYAFGNKISDKVFSKCSPFSIVNGEYFILQFFNSVTPIIENILKSESKKANANINKHIAKYKPKK